MKTPKEINKIYDRLPKEKTDLSTHKVELAGLADKAKKLTADLEKGNRDFMSDYMATISEAVKKGQKELDRLGAVYRLAKGTEAKLIDGLKNLGMKASDNSMLTDLQKVTDKFENYVVKESKKYFS